MGDNRTITYVSDSTSGIYSDYLWTTSRASEIPTPTDMAIEKSGGAMETKIKFGHKKEQIPAALQNWIENKLYCTPGISIKTLAKHIGINSNYLSFTSTTYRVQTFINGSILSVSKKPSRLSSAIRA